MVLTVRRNGSSFTTHDERRYDVWGSVRAGSGASSQRYCASLGHVSDDESGLIYVRARYYEPGSGRFVSEDPARDGINYFVYARQNPTCLVDKNGKFPSTLLGLLGGGFLTLVGVLFMGYAYEASRMSVTAVEVAEACQFAQYAVICCGMGLAVWDGPGDAFGLAEFGGGMLVGAGLEWVIRRCGVESATAAAAVGLKTKGHLAVGAAYIYCLLVTGFIVADFLGGL